MDTEPPDPPGDTGSAPPLLLAGEQEDPTEPHIIRSID
ncbi:surface protein [Streptomyces sp. NPDC126497]